MEHFVSFGAAEGRLPFRGFDLYLQAIGSAHGSNLEAYRQYLAQRPQPGIPRTVWGAAADAEIRCLKEPSFDGELALFVTYSPDGWLKPHVRRYVDSLRREGIAVALIVSTDMGWKFRNSDLLSSVDGLFVRQNKGFDFAAWAHVLQLRPETGHATILYLVNDSLIGPIDQTEVAEILRKIRASKADVIGLTENRERGWHLQSYFLAFKPRALHSTAFASFIEQIVCYEDKLDVIADYELRFATDFKRAGLDCEPIFRAPDARNPTTHHWKQLINSGFPFVKAELFQDAEFNADHGPQFLSAMGFDIRLAERSPAARRAGGCRAARAASHAPTDQTGRRPLARGDHARIRDVVISDPMAAARGANAHSSGSGKTQIRVGKSGGDPEAGRRIACRIPRRNVNLVSNYIWRDGGKPSLGGRDTAESSAPRVGGESADSHASSIPRGADCNDPEVLSRSSARRDQQRRYHFFDIGACLQDPLGLLGKSASLCDLPNSSTMGIVRCRQRLWGRRHRRGAGLLPIAGRANPRNPDFAKRRDLSRNEYRVGDGDGSVRRVARRR